MKERKEVKEGSEGIKVKWRKEVRKVKEKEYVLFIRKSTLTKRREIVIFPLIIEDKFIHRSEVNKI